MAIPLTAAQTAALTGEVRKPRQMVEITLGENVIHLSTGDNFTWNDDNYVHTGVSVSEVRTGKGGIQTCRIKIIDENNVYSDMLISLGFVYRAIKYWTVYGEAPYNLGDPVLQFVGEVVRVPSIGSVIVFDCATKNGTTRKVPAVTLGPPSVKHLPFPGQKAVIGNELYIVDIS